MNANNVFKFNTIKPCGSKVNLFHADYRKTYFTQNQTQEEQESTMTFMIDYLINTAWNDQLLD